MSAGARRLTLVPQAQPTLAERAAVARVEMDALLKAAVAELLTALEHVEITAEFVRTFDNAPTVVRERAGRIAAQAGGDRADVVMKRIADR